MKPKREAPYFRFGTLIHKALELYYPEGIKRGAHPAATFVALYEEEIEKTGETIREWSDEDGTWQDALELGVYILEQYVKKYGAADKEYRVISSEKVVQVPLAQFMPVGRKLPRSAPQIAVARIDGVWQHRSTKRYRFVDYKTTGRTINTNHLALDPQASLYWLIGPIALDIPAEEFEGIYYTFMRKFKPDKDRPMNKAGLYLNKDGSVSKLQPAPILHRELVYRDIPNHAQEIKRLLNLAREIAMVRDGKLAATKQPSQFKCGMCQFVDACELHEAGQDWQEYLEQTTTTWEPYEGNNLDPVEFA